MREQFANRSAAQLLTYEEAGRRKLHVPWDPTQITEPEFTGRKVLTDFPIEELVPYIDWSPFFHTWEMRGRYPDLLDDPVRGPAARELFANARELLEEIVQRSCSQRMPSTASIRRTARATISFFTTMCRGKRIDALSHVTPTERELEGQAAIGAS